MRFGYTAEVSAGIIQTETLDPGTMSDADLAAVVSVWRTVFAAKLAAKTVEELVKTQRDYAANHAGPLHQHPRISVARQDGRILAVAKTFAREIETGGAGGNRLTIMALYGVASLPEVRSQGFGAAVARAAFTRVDDGFFPLCLFQTGDARPFYEKLGCRTISNRFINSFNEADPAANPWWNPHVMIYPAGADWPEGMIDLRGTGY